MPVEAFQVDNQSLVSILFRYIEEVRVETLHLGVMTPLASVVPCALLERLIELVRRIMEGGELR